jgi:hypothetical protein
VSIYEWFADAPVGSVRWQLGLLGITVLGAIIGVGAAVTIGPFLYVKEKLEERRKR